MHYKALTKHLLLTSHSIIIVTIHTIADLEKSACVFIFKKKLGLTVFKKHISKTNDAILRELGMSKGGQIDVCNPIVPIDLQMGE